MKHSIDELRGMKARELDSLVAESIGWTLRDTSNPFGEKMPWKSWYDERGNYVGGESGGVRDYSTDPAASAALKAWLWKSGRYDGMVVGIEAASHYQPAQLVVKIWARSSVAALVVYSLSSDLVADECRALAIAAILAAEAWKG